MTERRGVVLVAALLLAAGACFSFPRWTYTARTQVRSETEEGGFSAAEISRAERVAAEVARSVGMKSELQDPSYLEVEEMISDAESPPRDFLSTHKMKQSLAMTMELRVEVSEDRRVLWFSVSDYEHGSSTPEVTRITVAASGAGRGRVPERRDRARGDTERPDLRPPLRAARR